VRQCGHQTGINIFFFKKIKRPSRSFSIFYIMSKNWKGVATPEMRKTRRSAATAWCCRGVDEPCLHNVLCCDIDVDAKMDVLVGVVIESDSQELEEELFVVTPSIEIPRVVLLKEEDNAVAAVLLDDDGQPLVDDEEGVWLDEVEEFDVWHHIVGEIKEHAVRETALNTKRLVALKSMPHKNGVICNRCFHSDMPHCVSATELLFSQRVYSKLVEDDAKKEELARDSRKKELDVVRRVGSSGIVILENVISDRPKFQEAREHEILAVLQHMEDSYIPGPPPIDDYVLHTQWSVVAVADKKKIRLMCLK
jgi:hypothetical protein